MKTIYEGKFDFKGLWDMPSSCGLKIISSEPDTIIIVTELYKENPGTTITDATALLASQICDAFSIDYNTMIYIEHNPKTQTKLSFYNEEYFLVHFDLTRGRPENPTYQEISEDDLKKMIE